MSSNKNGSLPLATCYPCYPTKVVMDRGVEFMGEVRTILHNNYGARIKVITTCNPQGNSMVEQAHQMIKKNMIHIQSMG
jgi:predicted aconitase